MRRAKRLRFADDLILRNQWPRLSPTREERHMTFPRNPDCARAGEAQWPWSHRRTFMERLAAQGYSRFTLREYESIADGFCAAIDKRALGSSDLDGATTERLRQAVLKEIAEYVTYLRRQRGLAESTIRNCIYYMERFLAFRFGEKLGDLNAITPDDIVAFLRKLKTGSQPRRCKALPSHLRTLFKFLFWSGKTKRDLAGSLPRVANATDHLPRYLKSEAIQRLIESARTDDAVGRRNYAMLLLMARLGLRAPEVIAIQLDDIDWRAGEILVRGKGKLHDRMPLPAEVGQAIVDYIRNGRAGASRALFVSART